MKTYTLERGLPKGVSKNVEALIYCGFDAMVTAELEQALRALQAQKEAKGNKTIANVYEMEMTILEATLYMTFKGIRVDAERVKKLASKIKVDQERLVEIIEPIVADVDEIDSDDFKWKSPKQLCTILYDHFRLATSTRTTGIHELRKLIVRTTNPTARRFIQGIINLKETQANERVLTRELSPDILSGGVGTEEDIVNAKRLSGGWNVAGTVTGRLTSSKDAMGSGGNMQNITRTVRSIFVPSTKHVFLQLDMKAAESAGVGALCWYLVGKDTYLKAVESGDVHTSVAMFMFPDRVKNRADAEREEYTTNLSCRQLAKNVGHGSNYWGSPQGIAYATGLEISTVQKGQELYFHAFPEIVMSRNPFTSILQKQEYFDTFFPRRLDVFDRLRGSMSTIRETAKHQYAYVTQSFIADCATAGINKIWKSSLPVKLLCHTHDGVLMEVEEHLLDSVVQECIDLMTVHREIPFHKTGELRSFKIEVEAQWGTSWGKEDLKEWKNG